MTIWSEAGKRAAKVAPLVGGALAGPAGAAIGGLVAAVLGVEATPAAVTQALTDDPHALLKMAEIEREHGRELKRIVLEAETGRLREINTTMRAELVSDDRFKSYWRPVYGYLTALTWTVQSLSIAWAMVVNPSYAAQLIGAVVALTPMWGIALAVLGINVHQRSQDKQVAAGLQPHTLLGLLAKRTAS